MSKQSTAVVVINEEGKILLVRRTASDSFHPLTYCLPGGGLDEGETPEEGALREVREEVGLMLDVVVPIKKYELSDIIIHYFYSTIVGDPTVVLQGEEQQQYEWCTQEEWKEMDLILDLKQHLVDIFDAINQQQDELFSHERDLELTKGFIEETKEKAEILRSKVNVVGDDNSIEEFRQTLSQLQELEKGFQFKIHQHATRLNIDDVIPLELLPNLELISGYSFIDLQYINKGVEGFDLSKGIKNNPKYHKVKVAYKNKHGKVVLATRYKLTEELQNDIEERTTIVLQSKKKDKKIEEIMSSKSAKAFKIFELKEEGLSHTEIASKLSVSTNFVTHIVGRPDKTQEIISDVVKSNFVTDKKVLYANQLHYIYQNLGLDGVIMYSLNKGFSNIPTNMTSLSGVYNTTMRLIRNSLEDKTLLDQLTDKPNKKAIQQFEGILPNWNDEKQQALDEVLKGKLNHLFQDLDSETILKEIDKLLANNDKSLEQKNALIVQLCQLKSNAANFVTQLQHQYALQEKLEDFVPLQHPEDERQASNEVIQNKQLITDYEQKVNWFNSFVHSNVVDKMRLRTLDVTFHGGHYRANASVTRINVQKKDLTDTIAHELGHIVEQNNEHVKKSIRDYFKNRTRNLTPKPLEKGFKCYPGFAHDYIGKIYPSGDTELVSMWFSLMYRNPTGFIHKDREHFSVVLKLLRGETI